MEGQRSAILHIDDDPLILRIVAEKLRSTGHEVISLSDPKQALNELIEHEYRVVLLDIDMPDINGLELLKQIKKQDGGIQVIMLTGLVTMNTVLESMRYGAEACIFKPITDFETLQQTLKTTYTKLERWWETLRELHTRKSQETLTGIIHD